MGVATLPVVWYQGFITSPASGLALARAIILAYDKSSRRAANYLTFPSTDYGTILRYPVIADRMIYAPLRHELASPPISQRQ